MQTAKEFLADLKDSEIDQMYSFWSKSRGEHTFPSQRDMDLPTIPKLLSRFYILDRVGNTFRYRFMGTGIDHHVGLTLTGNMFTDVRSGPQTAQITKFFNNVLDTGCMGLLTTRLPTNVNSWHVYRRVAYPVADDHEKPNKVTGLFLMEEIDEIMENRRTVLEGENTADGEVISQFAKL